MTIRQRIEELYKRSRGGDTFISIHANWTSEGQVLGFYLADWESPHDDFQLYKELDYKLDNEHFNGKTRSLGFAKQGAK